PSTGITTPPIPVNGNESNGSVGITAATQPLIQANSSTNTNTNTNSAVVAARADSSIPNLITPTGLNAAISNNAVNSISTLYGTVQKVAVNPTVANNIQGTPAKGKTLTGGVSNLTQQTLDNGATLLAPDENSVIETPYGTIKVEGGAVALVIAFDKGLAVFDLHDGHKGAVTVSIDDEQETLMPGKAFVAPREPKNSFEKVNPTAFVAFRKLHTRPIGKARKGYQAEFEIMSLMRGLTALRGMMDSQAPGTQKMINNMLKTAAILNQLNQSGEAFRYFVAPPETAYLSE
ncbi:MAG: hypothetical protein JSS86_21895, partial [Cyanobacteria bacterium SZAS LIN-2]|nr:hypothetical protein [Cyanobacteria bacterium SZAS LIN-2]